LLAAVYPSFLISDASLRSETLFALLVAISLVATYRALERPTLGRQVVLGALIGLAALARAEGLWLLLLLVIPVTWRAPRRLRWRLGLAGLLSCLVVLTPWLVRCWIVFDQPVLISTNSGDLLAGANCHAAYYGAGVGTWQPRCIAAAGAGNGAQVSTRLARRGVRYAAQHPGRLLVVLPARVLRTFGLFRPAQQLNIDRTEGRNHAASEAALLTCYGLLALSVFGGRALRRRRRSALVITVPLLLTLVVSLTAYGTTRFRIAADLTLVILAAVAIDVIVTSSSRHPYVQSSKRAPSP